MTYIQVELLQRPAVGLGHVLSGGGDVGLRNKQASQPYIEILQKENKIYMYMHYPKNNVQIKVLFGMMRYKFIKT